MTPSRVKPICIGSLVLTPGDPRIVIGRETLILRGQELALLELLAREAGRLISTETVAKALSRPGRPLGQSAVAVYVHRLRTQLEPLGLAIRGLRGFGYTLETIPGKRRPRRAGRRSRARAG